MIAGGEPASAVVIGATGGIGRALVDAIRERGGYATVHALSRSTGLDILDEESVATAARRLAEGAPPRLVIVATGVLQDDRTTPEKSWRMLDAGSLGHVLAVNAIGPALVAKHFLPLLPRRGRAVFAALSARVGSIGDNRKGGWHGYRASKAALNMLIRTLAIELSVRAPDALCVGLHPGTVDTGLSRPFQRNVPDGQLFSAARSAVHLLDVLDDLTPDDSGWCFDWKGERIVP